MRVLVVEPERRPDVREIDDSLKVMQDIVGGYIQPIYLDDSVALVCNDEGKFMDLPANRGLRDENGQMYDIVFGTFFRWINTEVLPELRRLARENRFYEWSDLVTIQSEDGAFMCRATPKGSGGEYLYIGCWEVEQEPTTTTTIDEDDDHHAAPYSTDGDYSLSNPWDAPGMSVADFI